MAQEVERRLGKAEATGSNPVSSLMKEKLSFDLQVIAFLWNRKLLVS